MVKITETFTMELTREEVNALKKLLGKRSPSSDLEKGLTNVESEIISELYFILPHDDKEEGE